MCVQLQHVIQKYLTHSVTMRRMLFALAAATTLSCANCWTSDRRKPVSAPLTEVLKTSRTVIYSRDASVPELVVVATSGGDFVKAPNKGLVSLPFHINMATNHVRTVVPPVSAIS